nr:retrovirus-related Pol polyprotein from transposon TNT 1-94 [Tanacetum cinerariifolium]
MCKISVQSKRITSHCCEKNLRVPKRHFIPWSVVSKVLRILSKGYLDSDYASCNRDRKSTSGACQLLGGKLVSWSEKKPQIVAMCSAKAEYVVVVGYCANFFRMKSQTSDYDIHYEMNYLREFWCTIVVEDPNPSTDDSKAHSLKEFIIKFNVKNDKTPLTLDYKTFWENKDLIIIMVKENQEKDKIGSKPDKNEKRVEARKSLKQLQWVKENPKKDKIRSKPDKNRKYGEARKIQKQLQWIEEENLKKTQKEGPEMQTHAITFKLKRRKKEEGLKVHFCESSK